MFAFRLAGHLGGMTVRELLGRMDSRELSEWMAFDDLEPLPSPWQQTGLLASLMANLWTTGRKRYTVQDFMPARRREDSPKPGRVRQSVAQMKAVMGRFVTQTKGPDHGPQ